VPKVLFSVSHPELAMQADGWDPTGPSPRSNEKLGWQCHLGHTWQASSPPHSRREMSHSESSECQQVRILRLKLGRIQMHSG
jgi:hypothetical protein